MPITKLIDSSGNVIDTNEGISQSVANEYIIQESVSYVSELEMTINNYESDFNEFNSDYTIPEVTKLEVRKAIFDVKKVKPDSVSVPKKVYKTFFESLITPLVILFTLILNSSTIPESMKKTDCFPLYKGKGRHSQASSYRAIFSLNCTTKVFERFLYDRLFSSCWELFNPYQHGFFKGRSCDTAVSLLTQDMYKALDKTSGKGIAVFVDFRKAFDSVNRNKLLMKLMKEFNVPPYLIRILCNYFESRVFRIVNGTFLSVYFALNNGCLPGSSLGPLLFSLYINDIGNCLIVPFLLFADDLVLYISCKSYTEGFAKMQEAINMLEIWCNENDLIINSDKTKCMLFYKNNDKSSKEACISNKETVKVYGKNIEVVSSFKYLGVIIESSLTFKLHYNHVQNKMNAGLSRMYSIRRLFSENVLKMFLSAFVISTIDYGLLIWCNQSETDICKLQTKISRFIYTFYYNRRKNDPKTDISDLYKKLDLLTILERKSLSALKFVYKFRRNDLFKDWYKYSYHGTKSNPTYSVCSYQKALYKNSVKWVTIHEWNKLIQKNLLIFDENLSLESFVDTVKSYLLEFRSSIYLYY
ncbi:unnamed protein product [Orchesella dallaii]|uniref:Reverse transcriptase domain-containing protein n=1 Tax=Orchesella dallaii TaxID=48710 RepID=A0ABP1Q5P3_9HEXA